MMASHQAMDRLAVWIMLALALLLSAAVALAAGDKGPPRGGTDQSFAGAQDSDGSADLSVAKLGPATILPGKTITYTLVVSNAGQLPAQGTWLTDILPSGVEFQAQEAAFPFVRPEPHTLVWDLGTVPVATAIAPYHLTVTALVAADAFVRELTNVVTVTSITTENHPADNHASLVTTVGSSPGPVVVIESVYSKTYGGIYDEAFRLMNVSPDVAASIGGWTFRDERGTVTFATGTSLAPGQRIWCARQADAFYAAFGFLPDYEWAGNHAAVPDLGYQGALSFNDDGDSLTLRNKAGEPVDTLVYGTGILCVPGWYGPTVQPYNPTQSFAVKGQVLYRKRDQATGLPVPDTDTAADWAQDPGDIFNGRKVLYPGWDLDQFFFTARVTETAVLTVAVGPDHLLETVLALIEGAEHSIWIEAYTFESAVLAQALVERLNAGVDLKLLLEGGPVGGADNAQRWICGQLRDAGGQVYFMSGDLMPVRYRTQHAKFLLIDDRLVLIGSENLNPSSMPADNKQDGTLGRRGVYLATDAPGVVDRVRAIMLADIDPTNHGDLLTCSQDPGMCTGSPPAAEPEPISYTVAFADPLTLRGTFAFEVIQSPDNALRQRDGLLGLLSRAGPGDTVLVEQFYEDVIWGAGAATPETDPNPRLEAYLDAARRGAKVRILLDSYFGAQENAVTVDYLQARAAGEGLDLMARLANPTLLGLHNKMILAQIDGRGHVHAGSINGKEVSSKSNRELALQVQSDEAYAYLKSVFDHDWRTTHAPIYLPWVLKDFQAPQPADHLLIGEVYISPDPQRQWVEVYNPTLQVLDLSGYRIGDAANRDDYEGMFGFPPGASIRPHQVLVVAVNAARFLEDFPAAQADFEIVDSGGQVPNLLKDAGWSEGDWWLRRDGDEVLLMDGSDLAIDAVAYGDSAYPGVVPHPAISWGHSLERLPAWLDSDDCSVDFWEQVYPNPGDVPQRER